MQWPWVSRERLEAAEYQIGKRDLRIEELEEKLLSLVDRIVAIKVDPLTISRAKKSEIRDEGYALPPKVEEAISDRSIRGSKLEVTLRDYAKRKLSFGDADPDEVAKEILTGSDAFNDEDW